MKAAIVGIAGAALDAAEAALLRAAAPAGVVLFARNILGRDQLAALVAELRDCLPADAVLMVDQEGGRVARLRPPDWRAHPAAAAIGRLYATDEAAGLRAAWLTGALIGFDCAAAGFDIVTAPVLDLGLPGAHAVIGDRAFGPDPVAVGALGAAMGRGLLEAGVQPVAKHTPGHGGARADSHLELPIVTGDITPALAPFRHNAHLPWAMTAHILYPELDATLPATLSPRIIGEIIRGRIGFDGVLVSDDLAMKALDGAPGALAGAALAAGCDLVLHCTGVLAETEAVLEACATLRPEAAARMARGRHAAATARRPLGAAALAAAMAAERERLLA